MLPLGTPAPDFSLPDTDGSTVSLSDLDVGKGMAVAFMSNHCPFVKHLRFRLGQMADEYMPKRVAFIAFGSNDVENYPDDELDKMAKEKEIAGYNFPYLYDETQKVVKPTKPLALRTFTFSTGTRSWSTAGNLTTAAPAMAAPSTVPISEKALDALLAGEIIPEEKQKPSLGCNIKWKPGTRRSILDKVGV